MGQAPGFFLELGQVGDEHFGREIPLEPTHQFQAAVLAEMRATRGLFLPVSLEGIARRLKPFQVVGEIVLLFFSHARENK